MTEMGSQGLAGLSPSAPPPPAQAELRPGKISDRLIAYMIDGFPFVAGYYICWVGALLKFPRLLSVANFPTMLAGAWIVMCWLYQFLGNVSGGTIGKRMMSLAVVDRQGRPLGAARSAVRAFGYLLSTPLCNFGFLIALLHPESRALHDLISGAVVAENRARARGESAVVFVGSVCMILGMVLGSVFFVVTQPTPNDLKAIGRAQDGLYIIAQIEEKIKAETGVYSASLNEIANASGDVEQFKSAMLDLYHPNLFQIEAGNVRYRITAAALDRKNTRVSIDGPVAIPPGLALPVPLPPAPEATAPPEN